MKLSNKKILIISPDRWGKIHLTKHHYTNELLERDNKVYFLSKNNKKKLWECEKAEWNENLYFINFKLSKILEFIRFRYSSFYNLYLRIILRGFKKEIGDIDLIICFESNGLFPKLELFKVKNTIFFPVDQIPERVRKLYSGFDFLFSVSPVILNNFPLFKSKYLVHHALNEFFARKALNKLTFLKNIEGSPIKVGYVGNLLIGKILDRENIKKIVLSHTSIEFHFFGPYISEESNVGSCNDKELKNFIDFLLLNNNCFLHGTKTTEELVTEMDKMDAFLLCYDNKYDKNKGSNAHKIIEYLSFGKVTISSYISMMNEYKHLIAMMPESDNNEFPELFSEVIKNLKKYNSLQKQRERIEFAISNTYKDRLDYIEKILVS